MCRTMMYLSPKVFESIGRYIFIVSGVHLESLLSLRDRGPREKYGANIPDIHSKEYHTCFYIEVFQRQLCFNAGGVQRHTLRSAEEQGVVEVSELVPRTSRPSSQKRAKEMLHLLLQKIVLPVADIYTNNPKWKKRIELPKKSLPKLVWGLRLSSARVSSGFYWNVSSVHICCLKDICKVVQKKI